LGSRSLVRATTVNRLATNPTSLKGYTLQASKKGTSQVNMDLAHIKNIQDFIGIIHTMSTMRPC